MMQNKFKLLFTVGWLALCATIATAQNTSLLQALSPKDGAEVSTAEPLFTWVYTQLGDYDAANYTLVITEKMAGQSPEVAIAANRLLLRQADIKTTDRKSTRLNSSHRNTSRMPSSA